jgi:serine/threonine protein kinase
LTEANVSKALGGTAASFLGAGTFGETWRVDGVDAGGGPETYAAKFLKPQYFQAALADRETGWLRRMNTPGIVRLFDVRTFTVEDAGHTTLLCEFIEGGSVADKAALAPPSHDEVIDFGDALLRAVEHVHEAKAVHRDIKPANVLLRAGRWADPVLIDFGLAKGAGDLTITRYPAQMGSLLWMSPEQLRGERARNASDLWACGVVLYELLSGGMHPYLDVDELRRVGAQADEIAELVDGPPRALPDGVPIALQEVVSKLLSMKGWARGSARRAVQMLEEMR